MYKFYSNCIPVKGYSRSIIYDLQNETYFLIPNSLYFLIKDGVIDLNIHDYKDSEKEIIKEYIEYLEQNNLIFKISSNELDLFPKLDLEWNYPSTISNAIIDIKNNWLDWQKIINELIELQCYHIQIRYFGPVNIEQIKNINSYLYKSLIFSVDFILPYDEKTGNAEWIELISQFPKISKIIFYNSPKDEVIHIANKGFAGIYSVHVNCNSAMHCGNIHPGYFTVNIPAFTESQAYNTCLNRKISIDVDGNIKNCPSCTQTFGSISDTSLARAIQKPGFKKYWNITKDQIDVCKDCEFRHICTDCRAFIKEPKNKYSQPLKCSYNPYISKWSDEEGYIPVEECGVYLKEKGFVPDKLKISILNEVLWSD
jgi:SPASM domain peptide maturase of grasp-with-spasm system